MAFLETSNNQYGSFAFWRQPIPQLDLSELEDLGLTERAEATTMTIPQNQNHNPNQAKMSKSTQKPKPYEVRNELLEYSSFNYWREPIVSINTIDFSLFL